MVELSLWCALAEALQQGEPCVLLAVVASNGSSPGRPGALMAVTRQGPLAGTIGGGRVERHQVATAMAALADGQVQPSLLLRTHRPGQNSSGMICGGSQTVASSVLTPDRLSEIQSLVARLAAGATVGWELSAAGWRLIAQCPAAARLSSYGDRWCYQHRSGDGNPVYLIGGGHVSLALSRLLARLDFSVTVIEERADIASCRDNGFAHRKLCCAYEEIAALVPEAPAVFVAVMTHDHQRDAAALTALKDKEVGYLGLLGSRAKVRQLLAREELRGLEGRHNVHAPMGIPIGSHTPEEIAVSVAAEFIRVKNGG